jgi:hypothetical protein
METRGKQQIVATLTAQLPAETIMYKNRFRTAINEKTNQNLAESVPTAAAPVSFVRSFVRSVISIIKSGNNSYELTDFARNNRHSD